MSTIATILGTHAEKYDYVCLFVISHIESDFFRATFGIDCQKSRTWVVKHG